MATGWCPNLMHLSQVRPWGRVRRCRRRLLAGNMLALFFPSLDSPRLVFLSMEQQLGLGAEIWFTCITFTPCRDLYSFLIAGLISLTNTCRFMSFINLKKTQTL